MVEITSPRRPSANGTELKVCTRALRCLLEGKWPETGAPPRRLLYNRIIPLNPSLRYTNAIDLLDLNADPPQWLPSQAMTVARASLTSAAFQDSMLFAGGKNETGSIIQLSDKVDYFLFSGSNGTIVDTNQRLSVPRYDLSGAGLSMLVGQTVYVEFILPISVPPNVHSSFTATNTPCLSAAATPTATCSTPSTCGPLSGTETPLCRLPLSFKSAPRLLWRLSPQPRPIQSS